MIQEKGRKSGRVSECDIPHDFSVQPHLSCDSDKIGPDLIYLCFLVLNIVATSCCSVDKWVESTLLQLIQKTLFFFYWQQLPAPP